MNKNQAAAYVMRQAVEEENMTDMPHCEWVDASEEGACTCCHGKGYFGKVFKFNMNGWVTRACPKCMRKIIDEFDKRP